MPKTIKTIWLTLFYTALLSIILNWPAAHKCQQCGKPAVWEGLLAHFTGNCYSVIYLGTGPVKMLHLQCLDDWLEANPLEFDEDGRLINVYDPRHSSNQ